MTLEAIDHVQVAIPAGGEAAARSFYGGVLGLAERPKPPELARRGGCWFENGRVTLHCGVDSGFTPATKAHIAFRVDDDLLEGHERIYIHDPFGNRLEFLHPIGAE